jgi:hypothetical protein
VTGNPATKAQRRLCVTHAVRRLAESYWEWLAPNRTPTGRGFGPWLSSTFNARRKRNPQAELGFGHQQFFGGPVGYGGLEFRPVPMFRMLGDSAPASARARGAAETNTGQRQS